jgi:hypothetical protein
LARLTPEDKQLLIDLSCESQLPADPVEVTHFFSFPLNGEGAIAASAELKRTGFETWTGTESSGDDYWHIAAWKVQSVTARVVAETRARMEDLASRHGGTYDFWDLRRHSRRREDWRIRSVLLRLRASRA